MKPLEAALGHPQDCLRCCFCSKTKVKNQQTSADPCIELEA